MKIEPKTLFKSLFFMILVLTVITGATSADLFVTKIIGNNKFSATTLDFSNRDTATNGFTSVLFNISGFVTSGFEVKGVRMKKDGKEDFEYKINFVKSLGDDSLCQALQLTVLQNWQIKYQGNLSDFTLNSNIKENGFDDWVFYINLARNEIELTNKICDFNFVFKTFRADPQKTVGFWDEEILTNHIASGTWTMP